jgi:hypothetical protein
VLRNVDWVEALWVLFTGSGLYFAFRLFREANADYRAINDSLRKVPKVHGEDIVAKANRRFGFIVTLYMFWYLVVGVLAMTQPAPAGRTRTGLGIFSVVVFVSFQALFSLGLWLNLRDRLKPE